MDKIEKTFILVNSLGGGGAERQITYLQQLSEINKIVCIEPLMLYDVPQEKYIFLTKSVSKNTLYSKLIHFFQAIIALKKLRIDRQTHLICFLQMSTLLGVYCKIRYGCKLTLSIRINPFMHQQNQTMFSLSGSLLKYMFSKTNYIVPNSIETSNDIKIKFPKIAHKVYPIVNGYDIAAIQTKANTEITPYFELLTTHPCLLNAGRMDSQKGHWHLLRIFSKLRQTNPSLKLVLLGHGILINELVALSQSLHLRTYQKDKQDYHHNYDVYFLGFVENPYFFYKHAKLFLFPSIYEGLPNVIIESLICETPVISTNCKSGPFEILLPDQEFKYEIQQPTETSFGYIMPVFSGEIIMNSEPLNKNELEWVETCLNLLQDSKKRNSMKENCHQIQQKYSFDSIAQCWVDFLKEASA